MLRVLIVLIESKSTDCMVSGLVADLRCQGLPFKRQPYAAAAWAEGNFKMPQQLFTSKTFLFSGIPNRRRSYVTNFVPKAARSADHHSGRREQNSTLRDAIRTTDFDFWVFLLLAREAAFSHNICSRATHFHKNFCGACYQKLMSAPGRAGMRRSSRT